MDYASVLVELYPNLKWQLNGDDYDGLIWDESNAEPKPTKAALDAAWPAVRDANKWAKIRAERDRLLADSDWTQVPDAPVNVQAWADYRQALRDIPQTQDDPDSIVWPETP